MRQNINNLIDRITQECKLNEEYLNEGNSVKANIASKKLLKIRNDLLEDRELSEKIINELIYHQNPTVKSYIASIALNIQYRGSEAEKILVELSEAKIGAVSINSAMTLKVFYNHSK